jgi:hypothetical protein
MKCQIGQKQLCRRFIESEVYSGSRWFTRCLMSFPKASRKAKMFWVCLLTFMKQQALSYCSLPRSTTSLPQQQYRPSASPASQDHCHRVAPGEVTVRSITAPRALPSTTPAGIWIALLDDDDDAGELHLETGLDYDTANSQHTAFHHGREGEHRSPSHSLTQQHTSFTCECSPAPHAFKRRQEAFTSSLVQLMTFHSYSLSISTTTSQIHCYVSFHHPPRRPSSSMTIFCTPYHQHELNIVTHIRTRAHLRPHITDGNAKSASETAGTRRAYLR